ncbi:MAG: aspartate-semialdehyde dehydrogenase [Myxococcota bacterium]
MPEQGTKISDNGFNVAVVGATGAVGREMLRTLEQRDFPIKRLRAMASSRSAGEDLPFADTTVTVEDLEKADFEGVDFGLFSAGSSVSVAHADRAVEQGVIVIDNTSAFRMDPDKPLVVPEVNPEAIVDEPGIIANPNCSTIQMVVALKPLHERAGLERVIVSTYQSASGAGQRGIDDLMKGLRARLDGQDDPAPEKFAHPLAFDVLPHIDVFYESGFTKEELKMVNETRKIMDLPGLRLSATCVRVPVLRSHSESITVDLAEPLSADEARELWSESPGVKVYDEPEANQYPLARLAEHTDDTWIGRVRNDLDMPNTLHFWVVSDNLRKGAALNAVQIAEAIVQRRA